MLQPIDSPVHPLVSTWWNSTRPPQPQEIVVARIFLFTAATREIEKNHQHGTVYDPLADHRFLWAAQWLDHAAGNRRHICPHVTAIAAVFFDPPLQATRQELAAGAA